MSSFARALPEQRERVRAFLFDLIHRALARRLVRAPPHQPRAVPEAVAAEMIVTNLDDELGPERLPFAGAFGRPAAGAARRLAGEAWRLDQPFQFFRQGLAFARLDVRGEPDVIEEPLPVV